ncbi:MAG: DUF4019 domain-containing protein [Puniceicoccales bacterium]|jgi:hypothetical protein|nr:DUF4019 domain-containing protein [Puniceicoccales bacterium]
MGKTLDRELVLKTFKSLGFSASSGDNATIAPQTEKVITWIELIDTGKYAESYQGLAGFAKGLVKETDWSKALSAVRPPLGKVVSRKFQSSKAYDTRPGLPTGNYCILTFTSEFTNKKKATETVTYARESDGTWKAAGYFIQ